MNHCSALRALLPEHGLDALLLTSPVARLYASGFDASAGMAVITPEESYYYTDFRFIEAARARLQGFRVCLIDKERTYARMVGALLEELGVKTLGFEQDTMSAGRLEALRTAWPRVTFAPAQEALDAVRRVKTEEELALMTAAQRVAERAFEALLPKLRLGMTERQARAELIYQLHLAGADNISFDPIVVAGPNSALPHGEAGDRPLQRGDFLTLDFGAKHQGYCSDTTRTIALGEATGEMRHVYDVVLRAQAAGIAAARAGVVGADLHQAAQAVIDEAGFGEAFGHGLGHGIGLEVHEPGGASPSWEKALPAGMALSIEPGVYLPGRFGVRVEDVVVLTESGCRNLTALPKELLVL